MTLGDPTGVGPELIAKLLADEEARSRADVYLIGDREEFLRGQRIAGLDLAFVEAASIDEAEFDRGLPVLQHVPARPGGFTLGNVSADAGRHALETLGLAVDLAAAGAADAVCFAPLNKAALHAGGNPYEDELHWLADRLGVTSYFCEINVLGDVWSSRVSSHVPLKDVSRTLSVQRIVDAVQLIHGAMLDAGLREPRIAVCGLNPHLGDGGLVGREEIEIIAPAVALARRVVPHVDGPFPADTIFLKIRDGEYDAVVTMYHDQGQIALKLMGFERAVSVQGGLPVPITTPAHGTAYQIVGKNVADPSAIIHAFDLACRMAERRARGRSVDDARAART